MAVLYQCHPDGGRNLIAHASANFDSTEFGYHSNEKEYLAVIRAMKHFPPYLNDETFTLRTENEALTCLAEFNDTRGKLTRWVLLLQEFFFELEHCPGKENELPSR